MDRHYETLWICNGNLAQEEVDTLVTEMEGVVRTLKGNITKVDKQGKRRLAYAIDGQREGYYTLFEIEGAPEVIAELERKMRLHDQVLRYQTVVVDSDQRRAAKLHNKRHQKKEKRAQRREGGGRGAERAEVVAAAKPAAADEDE